MMKWLEQQSDANPTTPQETVDTSPLKLLETMKVNLVEKFGGLHTKFTVSKLSESVGIASIVSITRKPLLFVMYQGTNKPPLILAEGGVHTSAIFITISDQEYLATVSEDQIHLWNPADKSSSVAYKFTEHGDWRLCVIDERTVACIATNPSSIGHNKVYILNTDSEKFSLDSEKFSLSGTLHVKPGGTFVDICHIKATDGTPCLILSLPYSNLYLIKCVEMVGGRVRWQVDTQQIGRSFVPFSICTDGSTVFVANASQDVLYLLSVEDGSVIMSINLSPFGCRFPSCVRLQGDHLFVGHMNTEGTYYVSKFPKPTAVLDTDSKFQGHFKCNILIKFIFFLIQFIIILAKPQNFHAIS